MVNCLKCGNKLPYDCICNDTFDNKVERYLAQARQEWMTLKYLSETEHPKLKLIAVIEPDGIKGIIKDVELVLDNPEVERVNPYKYILKYRIKYNDEGILKEIIIHDPSGKPFTKFRQYVSITKSTIEITTTVNLEIESNIMCLTCGNKLPFECVCNDSFESKLNRLTEQARRMIYTVKYVEESENPRVKFEVKGYSGDLDVKFESDVPAIDKLRSHYYKLVYKFKFPFNVTITETAEYGYDGKPYSCRKNLNIKVNNDETVFFYVYLGVG